MKSFPLKAILLAALLPFALPLAAVSSAHASGIIWQGREYCWYDTGWNGPGWYRCGFAKKPGRGWGGPQGWPGATITRPSSGAAFERPPPTPPVGAPSIAWERYVEPLRGGPAAGSLAGPLRGY
jgi:hypothetical protein